MTDDLTRQDEDLSSAQFEAEERHDHPDFGYWPELAGLILTAFVCWLIFAFRG